ncbi:MAG: hypothetical protein WBW75_06545 [Mycobacterium sp.]|uniref:hypothetical protein n=1 Tax=Mycobacterium sp. TaxID=1785 RepID=UPI003C41F329
MDIEDATRHQERFEPQVVNEHQRRLSGIDEMLLALPAKGLTTGEVAVDFADVYDRLRVLAEPAAVDKLVAELKSALIVHKKPKISCAPLGCGCCRSTTRTSNPTSQKSRKRKALFVDHARQGRPHHRGRGTRGRPRRRLG